MINNDAFITCTLLRVSKVPGTFQDSYLDLHKLWPVKQTNKKNKFKNVKKKQKQIINSNNQQKKNQMV